MCEMGPVQQTEMTVVPFLDGETVHKLVFCIHDEVNWSTSAEVMGSLRHLQRGGLSSVKTIHIMLEHVSLNLECDMGVLLVRGLD